MKNRYNKTNQKPDPEPSSVQERIEQMKDRRKAAAQIGVKRRLKS